MDELKFRFVMALALTLSVSASADWADLDPTQFEMAGPPKKGTAAYKNDFAELHRLQENRLEDDCRLARRQLFPSFAVFFANSESPLSDAEAAKAKPVVQKVIRAVTKVGSYFKEIYDRPRPYDVDEDIKPCIKPPGGSKAYPSSHAAAATAGACVLAKMYPKKADELKEYGTRLGDLRKIVGVHHPSDVADGQKLGQEICDVLLADEEFRENL